MAKSTPLWKQRYVWAVLVGLASLSAWIVGLGAGMRAWILTREDLGIVAHAQAFGEDANIWWIPASILTLTAVVIGIGTAVVHHLVDGPVTTLPPFEPVEALTPVEPAPHVAAGSAQGGSATPEDAPGEESDAPPELLETEGLSEHDFSDLQEEEGESIDDDGSDPDRPVDR